MKKLIPILLIMLMVIACKRDPAPRDAIKPDVYVDVLVDVHIAEAIYKDRKRFKIDSVNSEALYLSVLEKYAVTEDQMLITALYYSRNQREYKKIWTEVLDKISIRMEQQHENETLELKSNIGVEQVKDKRIE